MTSNLKFSFPFFWASLAHLYMPFACAKEYSMPSPAKFRWHFVDQSTSTPSHSPRYIKHIFSFKKSVQSASNEAYSTFPSKYGSLLFSFEMYVFVGSNNPHSQSTYHKPFGLQTHPSLILSSSTLTGMFLDSAICCTSFIVFPLVFIPSLSKSSHKSCFNQFFIFFPTTSLCWRVSQKISLMFKGPSSDSWKTMCWISPTLRIGECGLRSPFSWCILVDLILFCLPPQFVFILPTIKPSSQPWSWPQLWSNNHTLS